MSIYGDPIIIGKATRGSGDGDAQLLARAVWDALTIAEKQSYGYVGIVDSEFGYMRGSLVYGADFNLKTMFEATSYSRLSTSVEDGATFQGRYFTRTSNEPVVFCGHMGSGGYNSYCVISKSNTAPAETHNSFGELVPAGSIEIDGTTLYLYVMGGAWSQPLTNITYTYETESLHFTTDAYMKASTVSGGSPTIEGSSAAEFTELLKLYAAM